jgi:hypothetical protein
VLADNLRQFGAVAVQIPQNTPQLDELGLRALVAGGEFGAETSQAVLDSVSIEGGGSGKRALTSGAEPD